MHVLAALSLPSRYLTPITPGKMLKGSVDISRGNSYGGQRLVAPAKQPSGASAPLARIGRRRAVADHVQWMKTILCPVSGAFIFTAYDSQ
jgi:hypothetical protein